MKKILKKEVIIAFILGILIASSVAVYAHNYLASSIDYTIPNTETTITVEEALNYLYGKKIDFDSADNVIHGNDGSPVSSLSGLEVGKYYILYMRYTSTTLPTITGAEIVIPMRNVESINGTSWSYIYVFVGVIKAEAQTITLSSNAVVSAKPLNT